MLLLGVHPARGAQRGAHLSVAFLSLSLCLFTSLLPPPTSVWPHLVGIQSCSWYEWINILVRNFISRGRNFIEAWEYILRQIKGICVLKYKAILIKIIIHMLGKHASKSFVRRQLKVKRGGETGGTGFSHMEKAWTGSRISPNLQI